MPNHLKQSSFYSQGNEKGKVLSSSAGWSHVRTILSISELLSTINLQERNKEKLEAEITYNQMYNKFNCPYDSHPWSSSLVALVGEYIPQAKH